MYQVRLLDKDLRLKAILKTEKWSYNRRINEATNISVSIPKDELKRVLPTNGQLYKELVREQSKYLKIAYFIQIWKDEQLKASGKITSRDSKDNVVEIKSFTEEILLERNITPAQYGKVFEGMDIADLARELTLKWEIKRVKAQSEWENNIESSNIDTSTQPGVVMIQKTPLGNYYDNGYIILRFRSSDYNDFVKWDRVRWLSDNESPVRTTVQYRYGEIGDLSPFSSEIEGVFVDEIGLDVTATDESVLDVKINLYTNDTTSEDSNGDPVGSTPFVFALEVIARTEFEVREGNVPISTGATVSDIDADNNNCLDLLVSACEQVDYEFKLENKQLSLAESFGQDLTDSVMLKNGQNIKIDNLGDDDSELVNILIAQGAGDGINRLQLTLRDNDSIEEYGEYPDTKEFDTEDITELANMAQDYLDGHNTPVQSFEVNGRFDYKNEPKVKVGDTVKVVDPESGIITNIDIAEEKRSYSDNGISVKLNLGKASKRLVDGVISPGSNLKKGNIPVPRLSCEGLINAVQVKSSFPNFSGWSETKYYISTQPNFEISAETLGDRGKKKKTQIGGLQKSTRYYIKAVNFDEDGGKSDVSDEISVVTKAVSYNDLDVNFAQINSVGFADFSPNTDCDVNLLHTAQDIDDWNVIELVNIPAHDSDTNPFPEIFSIKMEYTGTNILYSEYQGAFETSAGIGVESREWEFVDIREDNSGNWQVTNVYLDVSYQRFDKQREDQFRRLGFGFGGGLGAPDGVWGHVNREVDFENDKSIIFFTFFVNRSKGAECRFAFKQQKIEY